jgi:hypothetical protein
MTNLSTKNKLLLCVLVSLVLALTSVLLYFRWQIDKSLGGNTEMVDVTQFETTKGAIAIINVNVLSADSQTMLPNHTVLVSDKKITAMGENLAIPNNFYVIDGSGQYLMPGLIDSHVHIKKSQNDFLLYVANGITQIGEMTGMQHQFEYAKAIENGAIGPNMFIASPKVNNKQGLGAMFRSQFEQRHQSYATVDDAREAVRHYKAMGYDAIKLSSTLSADIYYGINNEAQKLNMPVIGHLPVGLTLNDLYQSGQSQLSHIDSISQNLANEFGGLHSQNSEAFIAHVAQLADSIAIKFKQNNIALASTVWLHQTVPLQDFDLANFLKSIEYEYQNPGWVEGSGVSNGCLPGGNSYENPNNTDAQSIEQFDIYYQAYNKSIKIMTQALIRHNVTITAGTDALGACGMIAGFSLHKELEALNSVGMSNAQVLQSATTAAAKWMGINTGVIKPGYRADLLLLNKNPLGDIRHTKTIQGVMVNGQYLDRAQLDKMLAAVKQANDNSRTTNIDAYL